MTFYNSKADITDHFIVYLWEIKKRYSQEYVNKEHADKLYEKMKIKINDKRKK